MVTLSLVRLNLIHFLCIVTAKSTLGQMTIWERNKGQVSAGSLVRIRAEVSCLNLCPLTLTNLGKRVFAVVVKLRI